VPDFLVVLRGYGRAEVDAAVARAEEGLGATNQAIRQAVAAELRGSRFTVHLRGYDRAQVDGYLTTVVDQLEGQ
jgi:DivIVA domain-containing protein